MNKLAGIATFCAVFSVAVVVAGCTKQDPLSGHQYDYGGPATYPAVGKGEISLHEQIRYTFDEGHCLIEHLYRKGLAVALDPDTKQWGFILEGTAAWPVGLQEGETFEFQGQQGTVIVLPQKWYTVLKGTYTVGDGKVVVDWSTLDMNSVFAKEFGSDTTPETYQQDNDWQLLRPLTLGSPTLGRVDQP